MGYPLRISNKQVHFVTNTTLERQFFFVPGDEVNRIILSCLAYYAAKHKVSVFAFVFMSNHFHMIVQAIFCNLSGFMRDFQSAVARELNRYHNRRGTFFERRFSSEPILDDDAFVDKLAYTLNNPVKDHLVDSIAEWPGVSSWDYHDTCEPMVANYLDRDELRRLRRKAKDDKYVPEEAAYQQIPLELAKPAMYEDLSDEEAQARIKKLVVEAAWEHQKLRAEYGVTCVGPEAVCARSFRDRPANPKYSTRPICHCNDPELKEEYISQVFATRDAYQKAMGRYRRGKKDPNFPDGTFRPGFPHCVGAPPPPSRYGKQAT